MIEGKQFKRVLDRLIIPKYDFIWDIKVRREFVFRGYVRCLIITDKNLTSMEREVIAKKLYEIFLMMGYNEDIIFGYPLFVKSF